MTGDNKTCLGLRMQKTYDSNCILCAENEQIPQQRNRTSAEHDEAACTIDPYNTRARCQTQRNKGHQAAKPCRYRQETAKRPQSKQEQAGGRERCRNNQQPPYCPAARPERLRALPDNICEQNKDVRRCVKQHLDEKGHDRPPNETRRIADGGQDFLTSRG